MPQHYIDVPLTAKQRAAFEDAPLTTEQRATFDDVPLTPKQRESGARRFGSGAWDVLNPVAAAQGLAQMALHPIDSAGAILDQQGQMFDKAVDDYRQGRYSEMVGHGVASLVPLIGPAAAHAGERIGEGDVAGGLGETFGLVAPALAVGMLSKAKAPVKAKPPAALSREAQLAKWGLREGIPVDPASATANRLGRTAQQLSEHTSIPGSMIATKAKQARQQGLATVGERLAAKVAARAETPETAGAAVRAGVEGTIRGLDDAANQNYGALRKIIDGADDVDVPVSDVTRTAAAATAAQRFFPDAEIPAGAASTRPMRAPVDLRTVRGQLKPVLDSLNRKKELTGQLMGGEGRAVVALDKLVNGDDFAHLVDVDAALGDLKAMARGADMPELRSGGQGAAAAAVKSLSKAVDDAAASLGPDAVKALKAGRQATREKWAAAEVLDALKAEPVKTFKGATAPQDAAVMHLREIAKLSPESLPKVGRAVLDSMLNLATEKGGFDHIQRVAADWRKLGGETKKLLYTPEHVTDLDRFFALAEKMGENINPSGSALAGASALSGTTAILNPLAALYQQVGGAVLAKALNSPTVTRALVGELRVPKVSVPAKVKRMAEIVKRGTKDTGLAAGNTMAADPSRRPAR